MADGTVLLNDRGSNPSIPSAGLTQIYSKSGRVYVQRPDGVVLLQGVALDNANTSDVTANAADTYLTGSKLQISNLNGKVVKAGSHFRWRFTFTKSAAGVATPIWSVRCGTAGSTSDTALVQHTLVAQTAATDTGWCEIDAVIRDVSATGVLEAAIRFSHKNTTTGLQNQAQEQILNAASSAFDFTAANLQIGVSVNPGASGVWTVQTVTVQAFNLIST